MGTESESRKRFQRKGLQVSKEDSLKTEDSGPYPKTDIMTTIRKFMIQDQDMIVLSHHIYKVARTILIDCNIKALLDPRILPDVSAVSACHAQRMPKPIRK